MHFENKINQKSVSIAISELTLNQILNQFMNKTNKFSQFKYNHEGTPWKWETLLKSVSIATSELTIGYNVEKLICYKKKLIWFLKILS